MYDEFYKLISDRYSVRKFTNQPVDQETINKILAAGHVAPTACNKQPQRILVINDEESIAKLRKCTVCHFNAPTAMLVCYDKNECWVREYDEKNSGDIDASIITTHMMLASWTLGVGTTWVMHFIPEAVREEFSIPDNIEPVALLVMGYAASDVKPYPGHLKFRPMEDIVSYPKEEDITVKYCKKDSFVVIGKEGSTADGDDFIDQLWQQANSHFDEIKHLVKQDEQGNFVGFWGAMSDLTRSFRPWEEDFRKGLYLAGAECVDDAQAPAGWTKWVIPAYEFMYIENNRTDTFWKGIEYLKENHLELAGAVHNFICPSDGKRYMVYPIHRL